MFTMGYSITDKIRFNVSRMHESGVLPLADIPGVGGIDMMYTLDKINLFYTSEGRYDV